MRRSRYKAALNTKGLHVDRNSPINSILYRMAQNILHERKPAQKRKNGHCGVGTAAGKLTEDQVKEIRRRYCGKKSCAEMAVEFRMHWQSIYKIATGQNYAWVKA